MAKCTFCGENIAPGTGRMFVQNDSKILHFCSGKCRKNLLKMQRKPLKTKWSNFYKP